jgi:AraC-like DNA-binding protein
MDVLASFLDGPRARDAFLVRSMLESPWCLRVQDEAALTVLAIERGSAWISFDGDVPRQLSPGDVAVIRGPEPYTVADTPGRPHTIVIHPGQDCATITGESLRTSMELGVRTWGNSPTGSSVMLTGTYETDGEVSRRLLDTLPPLTVLEAETSPIPVVGLLADEVAKDEPGQTAVLDRLLDLLLVAALRAAYASDGAGAPTWYRAYGDAVVGPVLRLIHDDPAHPWTVAGLASAVGVSRAALARRFHDLVGEPPMTFLTGWRMAMAADLLLDPGATVGGVARQVGYGSPFTFSTAFKRTYGASPRDYRDGVTARTA